MSRQLVEMESILQRLIDEHRKLLSHVDAQQSAMKAFDLKAMDAAVHLQEAARLRIASLETQRRVAIRQIARVLKFNGDLTIQKLAELVPPRGPTLLNLRDDLKSLVAQIMARNHVAGKLAGAVLGHLNTVVRLLAGAVEQAGIYTKHGVPQVATRIGVLEAVA